MSEWRKVPIRAIYQRVEVRDRADLPLVSVYRDHGVVRRDERDDNNNRPSEDLSTYKHVRPGDLVVNKMKTWQGSLAVSGHEGIVSPAYYVGRRITDVDNRFMHHLLRSLPLIAEYGARSKGIRPSQWDLPWDEFASIKVAIPAFAKQKAIADYLDRETARIDALIEKKKRLTELASELVGSKIESVLDKFASNCPRPSLAYVLAAPITDGPHETPEFTESGVPFLSVDNIQESQINFSDTRFISNEENVRFSRKSKPRPGDVLLTKAASVGKVALVATDLEFNIWSPIAILRPNHEILSSEYLWWLFRSPRIQMQLQLYATSNTQQNISMRDLSSIRLDVPSLDAQVQCVNQLNRVDAWSRSLMTKISKDTDLLKERRQALITAAVTGELEISAVAA